MLHRLVHLTIDSFKTKVGDMNSEESYRCTSFVTYLGVEISSDARNNSGKERRVMVG